MAGLAEKDWDREKKAKCYSRPQSPFVSLSRRGLRFSNRKCGILEPDITPEADSRGDTKESER